MQKRLQQTLVREIADRANVSPSTVTRVLSGRTRGAYPKVALRNERIQKIALSLNYHPSYHGRALRKGTTDTVALLYPKSKPMMDGYYGDMVSTMVKTLSDANFHLVLWGVGNQELEDTSTLLERRFDGLLVRHALNPALAKTIRETGLPTVLVNCRVGEDFDQVIPDDRMGARLLANHLHERGHRRIAYVTPPVRLPGNRHYSVIERQETLRDHFGDDGNAFRVYTAVPEEVESLADKLMINADRSTAVICYSAPMAAHLAATLLRRGVRIPKDLSLATFSDCEVTRAAAVPLTVVDVPLIEAGTVASDLLLRRLASSLNEASGEDIRLPESLIVRDSTGSAPR